MKILQSLDDPFPSVEEAEDDGLLTVGGDLSLSRLLSAYQNGIFPWYSGWPPRWWSPDPRFVLYPSKIHVSRSMRRLLKHRTFRVTIDTDFEFVIRACASVEREGQFGTWISREMKDAYVNLHKTGYAHSVEVRNDSGDIVGGLYGVSLGRMFCGESMFSRVSNASKYGFITLVRLLQQREFELIDSQVYTPHLKSLGAEMIPRDEFIKQITQAQKKETIRRKWTDWI